MKRNWFSEFWSSYYQMVYDNNGPEYVAERQKESYVGCQYEMIREENFGRTPQYMNTNGEVMYA